MDSFKKTFLTPSSVSSYHVLDYVIPDILKEATDRFIGGDVDGISIRIFLHACSFQGEHPAARSEIDVMKRSAAVPCTLRAFQYQYTDGVPNYSCPRDVSSKHVPYTRSMQLSFLLRPYVCSAQHTCFFGMREKNIPWYHVTGKWPLFETEQRKQKEKIVNEKRGRILKVFFDPYLHNFAASGHLQKGVGKTLFEICFRQLVNLGH